MNWRDGLPKSDREVLDALTESIRGHFAKCAESMYLAGCELKKARTLLKQDEPWIEWLEEAFKPGFRITAWRLMHLAEKLEKPYKKGLLFQFGTSAVYELTAPGTPPEALERAIEEAEEGKTIDRTRARELVREEREEQQQAVAEALEELPPEQRQSIRTKAREKAIRDARKEKLSAMERHHEAWAALMTGEPDVRDSTIELIHQAIEECREALK